MFDLLQTSPRSRARLGRLNTTRGTIDTPVFMPVGTQASVKALDLRELNEIGTEILLGNTYHLFLRPGMDIIRKAGGLHTFMNWDKPILTDSGGFQVYSLAKIRSVRDDGVEFRSHLSGETLFLGPRESMAIQRELGSDIAMLFDECPPHGCSADELESAVKRTLDWAAICAEQPRAEGQFYFGIVQGANSPELRRRCAEELVAMDFDGDITATFTMTAFTHGGGRKLRIHGSEAELSFDEGDIVVKHYASNNVERISIGAEGGGHGGGDNRVISAWLDAIRTGDGSRVVTDVHESLRTHGIVFAAERARREGRMVDLAEIYTAL